jgi:hypothetical protein
MHSGVSMIKDVKRVWSNWSWVMPFSNCLKRMRPFHMGRSSLARNLEQEQRESRREAILAAINEIQESIKLIDRTEEKRTAGINKPLKIENCCN